MAKTATRSASFRQLHVRRQVVLAAITKTVKLIKWRRLFMNKLANSNTIVFVS